ncbi:MAG TPA: tyrosine-type recombinase/integrase [Longimicrobium sp.]|jgi:integrase
MPSDSSVIPTGNALVPVPNRGTPDEIVMPSVVGWREVYHDGDVGVLAVRVEGEDGGREALALRTGAAPRLTPESARALGAFLLEWADRTGAEDARLTELHEYGAGAIIARSFLGRFASEHSRRAMRSQLRRIAVILGHPGADGYENVAWHQLRYRETGAIRQVIVEQEGAPASKSLALAALRGVLKEAWKLGYMTAEQRERACLLEPIGGKRVKKMRSLTPGEIRALFIACLADPTVRGVRDAAIISVLYGSGVRRDECSALAVADYRVEDGAVHVRAGKGDKGRITYVQGAACDAVEDYLAMRGAEAGPLFTPIHRTGKLRIAPLSPQAIYKLLLARAAQASIPPFSPHDLRATLAGDLLDAGADIAAVKDLLGHASVNTTMIYDRRGERKKRKAASLVHVPYVRRAADRQTLPPSSPTSEKL